MKSVKNCVSSRRCGWPRETWSSKQVIYGQHTQVHLKVIQQESLHRSQRRVKNKCRRARAALMCPSRRRYRRGTSQSSSINCSPACLRSSKRGTSKSCQHPRNRLRASWRRRRRCMTRWWPTRAPSASNFFSRQSINRICCSHADTHFARRASIMFLGPLMPRLVHSVEWNGTQWRRILVYKISSKWLMIKTRTTYSSWSRREMRWRGMASLEAMLTIWIARCRPKQ